MKKRYTLDKKLAAYSAAAGVAFAGAGDVQAQQQRQATSPIIVNQGAEQPLTRNPIIYFDVDPDVTVDDSGLGIDMNFDGTNEFALVQYDPPFAPKVGLRSFTSTTVGASGPYSGAVGVIGRVATFGSSVFAYPAQLNTGDEIGGSVNNFIKVSDGGIPGASLAIGPYGDWLGGVTDKFLGLAVDFPAPPGAAGKVQRVTHFGWVRLDVADGASSATIKDYAVNFQANTPTLAGAPIIALPVELVSFEAKLVDGVVQLAWKTASEEENAGFEIQVKRADWDGFRGIDFVDGAGTTLEAQSYTYAATDLKPGRYQFRLRQIDFDGSFALSDIVETTVSVPGTHLLTEAYPNPFNPSARFELSVPAEQEVRVSLHDAQGREVQELFAGRLDADSPQTIRINAADLPSGVYLYRVVGANFTDAKTVSLVK